MGKAERERQVSEDQTGRRKEERPGLPFMRGHSTYVDPDHARVQAKACVQG